MGLAQGNVASLFVVFRATVNQFAADMQQISNEVRRFDRVVYPIGQRVNQIGLALSAGLTAPLVAAGAFALKTGVDFETAFAGVRKTLNDSEEALGKVRGELIKMSTVTPTTAVEFAEIATTAAQLGIQAPNIARFSQTMAELQTVTKLSGQEAANFLARFTNITKLPQDQIHNLASTLVALGNKFPAVEGEISNFGLRIAKVGATVGLTDGQILAFGTALASVGVTAERGGTAISTTFGNIAKAVEKGGTQLDLFATVAGQSVEQFSQSFKTDAAGAVSDFVAGIQQIKERSGPVFTTLDRLGLGNRNVREAVLGLARGSDVLSSALRVQSHEMQANGELTRAYGEKVKTTTSQFQIFKNQISALGIQLFDIFGPGINKLIRDMQRLVTEGIKPLVDEFAKLPKGMQHAIEGLVLFAGVIGPTILIVNKLFSFFGGLGLVIGNLVQKFGGIAFITGLLGDLVAALAGPVGVAVAAVAAFGAAAWLLVKDWSSVKTNLLDVWNTLSGGAKQIFGEIKKLFADVSQTISEAWKHAFGTSINWDALGAGIVAALNTILNFVAGSIRAIANIISGGLQIIRGIFDVFAGVVTLNWSKTWNGIVTIAGGIWTQLSGVFKSGVEIIVDTLTNLLNYFATIFQKIGQSIPTGAIFLTGTRIALLGTAVALSGAAKEADTFSQHLKRGTESAVQAGTASQKAAGQVTQLGQAYQFVGPQIENLHKKLAGTDPNFGKTYVQALHQMRSEVGAVSQQAADQITQLGQLGQAYQSVGPHIEDVSNKVVDFNRLVADELKLLEDPNPAKTYATALKRMREELTGNVVEMNALDDVIRGAIAAGIPFQFILERLGKNAQESATHLREMGKAVKESTQEVALANIFLNAYRQLNEGAVVSFKQIGTAVDAAGNVWPIFSRKVEDAHTTFIAAEKDMADRSNEFIQELSKPLPVDVEFARRIQAEVNVLNAARDTVKEFAQELFNLEHQFETPVSLEALDVEIQKFNETSSENIELLKIWGARAQEAVTRALAAGQAVPEATQNLAVRNILLNNSIDLYRQIEAASAEATASLRKDLNEYNGHLELLKIKLREIKEGVGAVPPLVSQQALESGIELRASVFETAAKIQALAKAGYNTAQIVEILGGDITKAAGVIKVFGNNVDETTKELINMADAQIVGQDAINGIIDNISKIFIKSIGSGKAFWDAWGDYGKTIIASVGDFFAKTILHAVFDPLKDAFGQLILSIKGKLTEILTGVSSGAAGLGQSIAKAIGSIGPTLGLSLGASLGQGTLGKVGGAALGLSAGILAHGALIGATAPSVLAPGGMGAAAGALQGLGIAASAATLAIGGVGAALLVMSLTMGKGRAAANALVNSLQDPLGKAFKEIVDANNELYKSGKQTYTGALEAKQRVADLWLSFRSQSQEFARGGKNQAAVVKQALDTLTPQMQKFFNDIGDEIDALVPRATKLFQSVIAVQTQLTDTEKAAITSRIALINKLLNAPIFLPGAKITDKDFQALWGKIAPDIPTQIADRKKLSEEEIRLEDQLNDKTIPTIYKFGQAIKDATEVFTTEGIQAYIDKVFDSIQGTANLTHAIDVLLAAETPVAVIIDKLGDDVDKFAIELLKLGLPLPEIIYRFSSASTKLVAAVTTGIDQLLGHVYDFAAAVGEVSKAIDLSSVQSFVSKVVDAVAGTANLEEALSILETSKAPVALILDRLGDDIKTFAEALTLAGLPVPPLIAKYLGLADAQDALSKSIKDTPRIANSLSKLVGAAVDKLRDIAGGGDLAGSILKALDRLLTGLPATVAIATPDSVAATAVDKLRGVDEQILAVLKDVSLKIPTVVPVPEAVPVPTVAAAQTVYTINIADNGMTENIFTFTDKISREQVRDVIIPEITEALNNNTDRSKDKWSSLLAGKGVTIK